MEEKNNTVTPDTSVQDSGGVTTETKQPQTVETQNEESNNTAYLNQKQRAEKAEALAKEKAKEAEALKQQLAELEANPTNSLNRDEVYLIAQNFDDETISKAKKIAALEGVSLRQAVETDLFKTWKTTHENTKKAEAAKITASQGSSSQSNKKTFETKNLSEDEHRALWRKKMGK